MSYYSARDMEVESLRSRVAQLESELREKEKDVYTAAELGKKLLESNQELQSQLEDNTKEYSERIEVSRCTYYLQFVTVLSAIWYKAFVRLLNRDY